MRSPKLLSTVFVPLSAALVNIGARARGLRNYFFDLLPRSGLVRKVSHFAAARIPNCKFLTLICFSHIRLPGWKHYSMAALLVYFGYMAFPYVETSQAVHCPDGHEYSIPEGPHAGRWVRCEDFDAYHAHMLRAEEYAASALLAPPK